MSETLFNWELQIVVNVGIRLESTRGIKLSPTTDTYSGIGNATGATGIITEFVLRIPLNSKAELKCSRDI